MKKLIRTLLLTLIMVCGFTGISATASAASKTITGTYRYDLAFQVLDYLNKERTKAGKSKLKMDKSLVDQAMTRAGECSIKYSHTRPNGKSFSSVGNTKGENIAYGYTSAKSVNTAWTNSKGHYKNMMTSYKGVGIGCFQASDGTLYWVEEFGPYTSKAVQKSNSSVGTAKGVKTTISSLTNTSKGIKVAWNRNYGVSGYYVYRKKSGGSYKKIKTITKASKTSYTDTSAKSGTKYTYKVVPYTKKDGKKGTGSTKSMVRVNSPSSLTASNIGYGDVKLTWKKASGVTGYKVEFASNSSFKNSAVYKVKGESNTSFTFTDLEGGKTYYFRISAYKTKSSKDYDSASTSKKSLKVSTQTVGTPKVTNVTSDKSGHATVTWNKVSGATGYKVYYSTDKNFSGTKYFYRAKSGSQTSYDVPSLTSGKTYYFKVKAYIEDSNGSHESKDSNVMSVKIK